MDSILVSILQPNIIWESPSANLNNYSKLISGISQTDLIILPEMFSTGFTMHSQKLKETMTENSVTWMKKIAYTKKAVITGSLIIEDNNKIYNRLLWITPDGSVDHYDKHHLFTIGGEHHNYSPGLNRLITTYKGWKFCPLICYDLRFPTWSRNTSDYDVLLYVANWPSSRKKAWTNLLMARAIENQCYCLGVNRVGKDGTGTKYFGGSTVIDAKGNATSLGNNEDIATFSLSYKTLHQYRKKFPVLKDQDSLQL